MNMNAISKKIARLVVTHAKHHRRIPNTLRLPSHIHRYMASRYGNFFRMAIKIKNPDGSVNTEVINLFLEPADDDSITVTNVESERGKYDGSPESDDSDMRQMRQGDSRPGTGDQSGA